MDAFFRIRTLALHTFFLVCAVAFVGCGNAYTPSEDAQLGKQINQEIEADPAHYPILNDAAIRNYVQSVANRVIQSPEVKFRDVFPYSVKVINDDKTVNAFCTPGGYIYVYTGLMKFVDNEAAFAGVLGHEIAHAELRHSTKRITKAYNTQILLGIVLGKNPSVLEEVAANLFTGLAFLKNSRDDESEADEASFRYLMSTSWYPGGIMYFFQKAEQNGQSGSVAEFFSTHPSPPNRLKTIRDLLQKNNISQPTETQLNTQGYMQIKRQLQ